MNQMPTINAKPQPNIYTVLLIIAILAAGIALGLVLRKLMSPLPDGYGLQFGDLFKPWQKPV